MPDACDIVPDVLKLQFTECGMPEVLSEMIHDLQGGSHPHDLCSIKIASNLIVSLLLGGERSSSRLAEEHLRLLFDDGSLSEPG